MGKLLNFTTDHEHSLHKQINGYVYLQPSISNICWLCLIKMNLVIISKTSMDDFPQAIANFVGLMKLLQMCVVPWVN
jgi:hypothetical protein